MKNIVKYIVHKTFGIVPLKGEFRCVTLWRKRQMGFVDKEAHLYDRSIGTGNDAAYGW